MEEIKFTVRGFLGKHFQHTQLKDDDDIFALGFINSLFAMQLVMFVENEFSITIDKEDLDIDNFKSIGAIAGLIERKKTSF